MNQTIKNNNQRKIIAMYKNKDIELNKRIQKGSELK